MTRWTYFGRRLTHNPFVMQTQSQPTQDGLYYCPFLFKRLLEGVYLAVKFLLYPFAS